MKTGVEKRGPEALIEAAIFRRRLDVIPHDALEKLVAQRLRNPSKIDGKVGGNRRERGGRCYLHDVVVVTVRIHVVGVVTEIEGRGGPKVGRITRRRWRWRRWRGVVKARGGEKKV